MSVSKPTSGAIQLGDSPPEVTPASIGAESASMMSGPPESPSHVLESTPEYCQQTCVAFDKSCVHAAVVTLPTRLMPASLVLRRPAPVDPKPAMIAGVPNTGRPAVLI